MGLDMYLEKRTYVKNWTHTPKGKRFAITVKRGGKTDKTIQPKRISYITEEVGCWRKANAIHNWIVKNVQDGNDDCEEYHFDSEKMQELHDTIVEVLEDKTKALDLLPPQEGFFFGGTDLDDYYWDELKRTKKLLANLLKEEGTGDFYYQSSW